MRKIKTNLDFKKVGKGIRVLRGSETQTDFGRRYRLTKGQIGHIEAGIRKPSIIFLWELHIEKKVPFDFILSGGKSPLLSKKKMEEKISLIEAKVCLRGLARSIGTLLKKI